MKRSIWIVCAAAVVVFAQEADRTAIAFSNPSGTKTVRIDTMQGDITVRGYNGNEVVVENRSKQGRRPRRESKENEGLKRIELGASGLALEERENVVTVNARANADLDVQIPANSALRVKTMTGEITVEGVRGELELNSTNGQVRAKQVEGSVIAHSLNGDVTVALTRWDGKPLSFSTLNGDIDLTLPADAKARLKIKADHGEVYSDFDMKLEASSQRLEESDPKTGRHRVRVDRTTYAMINGGGPEIAITTLNGQVRVRKAK